MIKTTWAKLNERGVHNAIGKLAKASGLDGHTAYRVTRFCLAADKAMNEARMFERELAQQHVTMNGKDFARDEEGRYIFNSPTASDEYEKAFIEKMNTTEVEIKVNPLEWSAIGNARILAPADILAIEEFIVGLPDPEEAADQPSNLILPHNVLSLK